MRTALFVTALALFAGACAAPPAAPDRPPLERLAAQPFEYHAELVGVGLASDDVRFVSTDLTEGSNERVEVACTVVSLEEESLLELVGWEAADGHAWTTPRAAAEALLADAEMIDGLEVVGRPRIAVFAGQEAAVQVIEQTAYLRSFEVDYRDGLALADPVVGVLHDGLRLTVRPRIVTCDDGDAPEHFRLDLELVLADTRHPIPEYEARLFGSSSAVTIQQPVVCTQTLSSDSRLSADECLVLVGRALDGTDRLLVLFVTAERAPSGERLI